MPDGQEEINRLSDKLRESHNKLTETLLEIVRPVNLSDFPTLKPDERTDLELLLDGDGGEIEP